MNKKTTGIISYFTLIGWLIAFLAGDRQGAKFHLNQSLILLLSGIVASLLAYIPFVGGIIALILNIAIFVLWIMGLIAACEDKEKELPIIGSIKILN